MRTERKSGSNLALFSMRGEKTVNLNNEARAYDQMDALAIITAILQVLDFQATMEQSSNDDIIRELHQQNTAYLERIERQNEEILQLLRGTEQQEKDT